MAAAGMQQSDQITPTGLAELRRYVKQAEDLSKGIYGNEFMSTRYYDRFGAFSHTPTLLLLLCMYIISI